MSTAPPRRQEAVRDQRIERLEPLVAPQVLPLGLIAYQYGWLGLLRRDSRRSAIAAICLVAVLLLPAF